MTDAADGIPLFDSISPEQLGSINLVLACLADGPHDIGANCTSFAHAVWSERRLG